MVVRGAPGSSAASRDEVLAGAEEIGFVLSPFTASRSTDVVVAELLGHRVQAPACFDPEADSTALDRALLPGPRRVTGGTTR